VRDPHAYAISHYTLLAWWALILLVSACLFAFFVAYFEVPRLLEPLFSSADGVHFESAWWTLFERPDAEDRFKRVTCYLTDQTVIEGTVYVYNPSVEETEERDLALGGPFYVEEPDGRRRRFEEGAIVVPASRLTWMHVDYLNQQEHDEITCRPLEEWRRRTQGVPYTPRPHRVLGWFLKPR
jgi:hypothetical protein